MDKPQFSPTLLIYAISLTAAMSGSMLGPVVSIYARDYVSASVGEVGLIVSIFSMTSLPSKILSGFFGRGKKILYIPVVGILMSTFCPLGMVLFPSPSMMLVFRGIQGFGNAMMWPSTLTLVALLAKDHRRNQAISYYTLSISIGLFAAPFIGSLSIATVGMQNTFLLSSAISAVSVLLGLILILFRKTLLKDMDRGEDERTSGATSLILKNRSFRYVSAILIAQAFAFGTLLAYGTLYAKDAYQVRDDEVALTFSGYYGVMMFTRLVLGKLLKYLSKEKLMTIGLVNLIVMLLFLLLSGNYPLFAIVFSILGFTHGMIFPIGAMTLAENLPRNILPVANALYTTAWDIGATLGPIVAAPLVARYTYRESIIVSIIAPTLILAVTMLLRKKEPKVS